jgi:hypothetical protein
VATNVPQADDLATDRQRRQELRALYRRGRIWQDGEAAIDVTLPALRCLGNLARREAPEIP